jgi:hypothetical protein
MTTPPWQTPAGVAHARLLDHSHRHWLGRSLLTDAYPPEALARALYQAPFVLVSHDTGADPRFNYANLAAQTLWELDWARFVGMPSRYSAEPGARSQRAAALGNAAREGFTQGYSGVRISARGRRFCILDGLIWNLLDPDGTPRGQAAMFARWDYL